MRTAEMREKIADLFARAEHARMLGGMVGDSRTQKSLDAYAAELEREAEGLKQQMAPEDPESGEELSG